MTKYIKEILKQSPTKRSEAIREIWESLEGHSDTRQFLLQKLQEDENPVVGYKSNGEPITLIQLKLRVNEAEESLSQGEGICQEEVERLSTNW